MSSPSREIVDFPKVLVYLIRANNFTGLEHLRRRRNEERQKAKKEKSRRPHIRHVSRTMRPESLNLDGRDSQIA